MERRLLRFSSLALLLSTLSGCADILTLKYDPTTNPRAFQGPRRPIVYVDAATDLSGGISTYQGLWQADRPMSEVLQEALVTELGRLQLPTTTDPAQAEAIFATSLTQASVRYLGSEGLDDKIIGKVTFALAIKDRRQKNVLSWTFTGTANGLRPGFGRPDACFSQAINTALANAVQGMGPTLESQDFVALIEGRAPSRQQIVAAAPTARTTPSRRSKKRKQTPSGPMSAPEEPAAESSPQMPAAPPAPTTASRRSDIDELPSASASNAHSHAIVIGVENYREKLPSADFAAADARLAAKYYKRVLGVPEENVALLINDKAAKSDFEKYFERWLPNRVEAGDTVYIYYSGHGAPNPKTGEAYLVPYDADPTYIEQTGYPIAKLYRDLSKLPAKKVVVAMDSCFSGAGGRSVIARGARPLVTLKTSDVPENLTVLTAAAGDQISTSYDDKGHGLFTYFFLKGLKEKGPNLQAVYDYLKPEVSKVARREYNADQTPQWQEGR